MLQQGDRLLAGFACRGWAGLISREEVHQGRADLFGRPSRSLVLERVPVAIADAETTLQGHRLLKGTIGPFPLGGEAGLSLGHWTLAAVGAILT